MIIQAQLSQCNTGIWTLKILEKYEVFPSLWSFLRSLKCLEMDLAFLILDENYFGLNTFFAWFGKIKKIFIGDSLQVDVLKLRQVLRGILILHTHVYKEGPSKWRRSVAHAYGQVSQYIVCHFCLMVSTIKRLLQLCLIIQLCQEVRGIISIEVIWEIARSHC